MGLVSWTGLAVALSRVLGKFGGALVGAVSLRRLSVIRVSMVLLYTLDSVL